MLPVGRGHLDPVTLVMIIPSPTSLGLGGPLRRNARPAATFTAASAAAVATNTNTTTSVIIIIVIFFLDGSYLRPEPFGGYSPT